MFLNVIKFMLMNFKLINLMLINFKLINLMSMNFINKQISYFFPLRCFLVLMKFYRKKITFSHLDVLKYFLVLFCTCEIFL